MPRFESPLGNKKFESQGMRELDVPDESNPPTTAAQNRRQRQLEEASNLNIDAIREFQNRMQTSQAAAVNNSSPSGQRFHGMGTQDNMHDLYRGEQEIREIKEIQHGRARLSESARRRVEILLGMVRDTRTISLPSGDYVLQTLRSQELRESFIATQPFDGTIEGPFEIRRQLLARSLIQVAGTDIEQFVGSREIEAKLSLLDELPEALLGRLFNEYNMLVDEARSKYAIKSEADAQEVLEDLKK